MSLRRCRLWKLFNCFSSCIVNPHVLQLYSSILLTRTLYSLILLTFDTRFLLNQILSSLLNPRLANLFLLLISSLPPSNGPTFFTFLHSSIPLLLFRIAISVLVSLTWRSPDRSIFEESWITRCSHLLLSSQNHQHIWIHEVGLIAFFLPFVVYIIYIDS